MLQPFQNAIKQHFILLFTSLELNNLGQNILSHPFIFFRPLLRDCLDWKRDDFLFGTHNIAPLDFFITNLQVLLGFSHFLKKFIKVIKGASEFMLQVFPGETALVLAFIPCVLKVKHDFLVGESDLQGVPSVLVVGGQAQQQMTLIQSLAQGTVFRPS